MSDQPTTAKPCPICGKPADPKTRPFCSRRCADVDLHRWFSGTYAVPAVESDEDTDEGEGEAARTRPDFRLFPLFFALLFSLFAPVPASAAFLSPLQGLAL